MDKQSCVAKKSSMPQRRTPGKDGIESAVTTLSTYRNTRVLRILDVYPGS
jgi:hypothetical protein